MSYTTVTVMLGQSVYILQYADASLWQAEQPLALQDQI